MTVTEQEALDVGDDVVLARGLTNTEVGSCTRLVTTEDVCCWIDDVVGLGKVVVPEDLAVVGDDDDDNDDDDDDWL